MGASTPEVDTGTVTGPLWRSAVYRFFAQALRPPDQWPQDLPIPDLPAPPDAPAAGGSAVAAAIDALVAVPRPALADAYHAAFGHQLGTRAALDEARYVPGGVFAQAQCTADVAGFYRAFGLEVADHARERPDHLSVELEFMHVLAYREAYARVHHTSEQVAVVVEAQRRFLEDHLGRWVPVLARIVQAETPGPYARAIAALATWVTADAAWLGATLEPDPGLAPPDDAPIPDDDRAACGAGRCPLEVPS
ncbi:MAG: molecular chaperone TorD family protein [Firmicutes bacterium]|nr:molecular chaperone TorD family protein [Bacillota bacterium]